MLEHEFHSVLAKMNKKTKKKRSVKKLFSPPLDNFQLFCSAVKLPDTVKHDIKIITSFVALLRNESLKDKERGAPGTTWLFF